MKLGRIFANAIARRIAYVIVAAALAWLGLGEARAQVNTNGCTISAPCARDIAWQTCQARLAEYQAQGWGFRTCTANAATYIAQACHPTFGCSAGNIVSRAYYWTNPQCPGNGMWVEATKTCMAPCPAGQERNQFTLVCQPTCNTRAQTVVTPRFAVPNGSVGCVNGCEAMYYAVGDGTYTQSYNIGAARTCNATPNDCANNGPGYVMNYGLSVCQPPVVECAANETKDPVTGVCTQGCPAGMIAGPDKVCKPSEDDCPAGNVRAPSGQCLPGEGQCAAGEARRPNGTCGRDADGDGEADEDDEDPENDPEEFFAGGDNCSSPPSCSGGIIDCGMARIQWRIDCNTRRTVNITGGACSAVPQCVGENCKAMEYAQLLQQWRATCALEKMADKEAGEGGNEDLIKLLTDPGTIQPDLGGTGDMPGGGAYSWGDEEEEFDPDTGGFGWSSSCPANPTVNVFGATLTFNLSPLCQWVGLGGYLVLILSSLACVRIISGGSA